MRCPDFERLIDYLDNRLPEKEAARVAKHLFENCPSCAETQSWYENVRRLAASDNLVEPPPWVFKRAVKIFDAKRGRPGLVERIGQAVASLVFDSFARPALAGIRSTETANRQLLYRAGDYSIDLQIAQSERSRADLIGQVLKEGETTFESVAGLRLEVTSLGQMVCSTTTDEMGEFKIGDIGYGTYDLKIELADGHITVPQLPVSQS